MNDGVYRRGGFQKEPQRPKEERKKKRARSASKERDDEKVKALNPGFTWEPRKETKGANGLHIGADKPIGKLVSDDKELNGKILYVSEHSGGSHVQLPPSVQFNIMPPPDKHAREVISIAGAAGAGKSWICRSYAAAYHKLFPKRDIFVISALNEDATLDKLPYLQRLKVHTLVDKPLENPTEAFEDSLCIFDDVEALVGAQRRAVSELLDALLTLGRHTCVSVLVASHLPARGKETRLLNSEAHRFVIFPTALGAHTLKYLLGTHVGMTPKQIAFVKAMPSRWVVVSKGFPTYVMTSSEARLLNDIGT